jgi:hypothetical protein
VGTNGFNVTDDDGSAKAGGAGRLQPIALLLLLALMAVFSAIRIGAPLRDPNFLTDRPEGMLRADPGLLFYQTERVIESGGGVPADFRADARVEHPNRTDLAELDSVGQEFPIAWAYLALGKPGPLHVFILWFVGIFSSLTVAAVYLLAREITGSRKWALFAALLFVLLPANYRTTGYLLMREDFSIPFFAFHLAFAARFRRTGQTFDAAGSGISLALALAAWHAMGFIVSVEAMILTVWYVRSGENPLARRNALWISGLMVFAALVVPVLWRSKFLFSLPPILSLAMVLAARGPLRKAGESLAGRLTLVACAVAASAGLKAWLAALPGGDDYGHVYSLFLYKLKYLGTLPADPNALSFAARIMWQGPFATLSPMELFLYLSGGILLCLPGLAMGAKSFASGTDEGKEGLLAAFAVLGLFGSWLVARLIFLPGILLPVLAAKSFQRLEKRRVALGFLALVASWQLFYQYQFVRNFKVSWYEPGLITQEYRALLDALPSLVPQDAAVTADSVISTAVLSATKRHIVLQPKWEAEESRTRIKEFLDAYFDGTPEDLAAFMRRYRSDYLLIDRKTLWEDFRYLAGIPMDVPMPKSGSPASMTLTRNTEVLSALPGFELIYRSPASITDRNGFPTDYIRLYRLRN